MQDQRIIDLFWERNETAIMESARKYGGYCYAIAYNILHNSEDAEECVNDTWLGAWKSIPPHRPEQLASFLGKITRNASLNRFKHYTAQKRGLGQTALVLSELEDCIPSPETVEQRLDRQHLTAVINQFLYGQPEQKRNLFIRRYWYLTPIKTLAVHYGMGESKVASLLFRMRKDLKRHLGKEGIHV